MEVKLPTARAIESFAISYCAAHGVTWAEVSEDTARAVRAGVSAGLMSMRGEPEPIGTALALETMTQVPVTLRAMALEIKQEGSGTGEERIKALYRIAAQIDALRASTRQDDGEAI